MSINATQLRTLISDVLKSINLYSRSAVELLMLTSAVESNGGSYIEQRGGPALGIFQMEPATHKDIWDNFLRYNVDLRLIVKSFSISYVHDHSLAAINLRANLPYQIVMARVHYLRVRQALPQYNHIRPLAVYWKKYYNTRLGKGTVEKAVQKYNRYAI